jgi:putative membrane protein
MLALCYGAAEIERLLSCYLKPWHFIVCLQPEDLSMLRMLLHWVVSALAVWITSRVVPGFYVDGAAAALIAAVVIGLVNATLGLFLKIITFPLTILSLGLFWFVINAIMLELASAFVPGFRIKGFGAAFVGGIVLTVVNILLKWLVMPSRHGY